MHRIRGGVVNIALHLAGDLRPVFADTPAMKQHAFGYVAGLLDELSIVGSRPHERSTPGFMNFTNSSKTFTLASKAFCNSLGILPRHAACTVCAM